MLKPFVSPRERGVLLVSFEPQLQRIVCSPTFPEIEDAYQVLFVPTWQPFYSVPLFVLAARARRPYGLMPSSSQDLPLCRHLGSLCEALPFQASSWVSADAYAPAGRKDVDLLMILGGPYKRHWKLFEALAEMPAGVKAVLAGNTRWPKRRESILSEAAAFGASDRITLVENPSNEDMARLLARARLFLGLSHREGSYIAVAEALMAGTPVGLFRNATIGSKEYVNPQTGVLFDPDRRLAPQIVETLERSSWFRPREWAVEHISARRNHGRLDALLARRSRERGEDWTVGIEPFHCEFFDFLYDGGVEVERRLAPAHAWLESRLGIPFVRPSQAHALQPERSASRT